MPNGIRVQRVPVWAECDSCAKGDTGIVAISTFMGKSLFLCDRCLGVLHRTLDSKKPEGQEGTEVAAWP